MKPKSKLPRDVRAAVQANPIPFIEDLYELGWSPEKIVVGMADFLLGEHPSVQSLRRWEFGKTKPTATYASALALLHRKTTGDSQ
jgi:hypothetical protein